MLRRPLRQLGGHGPIGPYRKAFGGTVSHEAARRCVSLRSADLGDAALGAPGAVRGEDLCVEPLAECHAQPVGQ